MKPNEKELKCIEIARRYKPIKLFYQQTLKIDEQALISVSEKKTFEQLWSDFGLRDFGVEYMDKKFSRNDKLECIKLWISELYDLDVDLQEYENFIIKQQTQDRLEIYKRNPSISHILSQDSIDVLPIHIDFVLGEYGNTNSFFKIMENLHSANEQVFLDCLCKSTYPNIDDISNAIHTGVYFSINKGWFELLYSFEKKILIRQPLQITSSSNRKSLLGVILKKGSDKFFRERIKGITNGAYELGGRLIERDYDDNVFAGHQFNYSKLKQEKFIFYQKTNGLRIVLKEFSRLKIIDEPLFIPDLNFYIILAKEIFSKIIADEKELSRISEKNYIDAMNDAENEINSWNRDFPGWADGRD